MRVLFVGDVHGKPGRRAVAQRVSKLRRELGLDFVVANGENGAGGSGITPETAQELFAAGVDVLTGGNHTWQKREALALLDAEPYLLRPANYPPGVPGRGAVVYERDGKRLGVINLQGRIFMAPLEDPFRAAIEAIEALTPRPMWSLVDMHAEATSEKVALGWYLAGRVTAVVGTHTHVQTADERILPGGTAYITDVGMTGPRDGVIGMDRTTILERFLTQLPARFEVASGPVQFSAVVIDADDYGNAVAIQRLYETL
ncbi:MAG: TIGR00282 family metallophosphoesterase, partial [Armatimonadetes bacterium]|nr:TIGR00282 family metallophosphoesterase [Armatimonadota bacterium]